MRSAMHSNGTEDGSRSSRGWVHCGFASMHPTILKCDSKRLRTYPRHLSGILSMNWSLTLTAFLAATAILPLGAANEKGEPDPVRIGMVQTLFADVPTPLVNLVTPTFKSLMKDFTGLNGDPNAGG